MMWRIKDFLYNHRKKFITCGVIAGAVVLATKYAQKALKDIQERHAKEFIQKTKRMKHYESTERTCNQAIIGLNETLCKNVIIKINTKDILGKLRNNDDNKIDLWNEMEILSITRLTTLIYGTTMLTIALRIQLNLLGGYIYKNTPTVSTLTGSIVTITDNNQLNITEDIQQNYLSLIQYFLKDGIVELSKLIEEKIRDIMKQYDLDHSFKLSDIEQLFWSIQTTINNTINNPCNNLIKFCMPDKNPNDHIEILNKMFTETLDMLESDDVVTLCSNNVSSGFSIALDNISEYFTENTFKTTLNLQEINEKSQLNTILNINKIEMPLAKLIPLINGLTSKGFENQVSSNLNKQPNLVTSMITYYLVSEKIKILGANVYEVFSI